MSKENLKLKLISFNTQGIRDYTKRNNVFTWLKGLDIDIAMLQETHSCKQTETTWEDEWGGTIIYSHGDRDSRGVCLCFKKKFTVYEPEIKRDKWGRIIVYEYKMDDRSITLCNIYGPNKEDPEFFLKTYDMIENANTDNILWGGDFNLILDPEMDKEGGNPFSKPIARKALQTLMIQEKLVDIWRKTNPKHKQYTWKSNTDPPIRSRLDYFLCKETFIKKYNQVEIIPSITSDHAAVIWETEIINTSRGKGTWKFNNDLLTDTEYCEIVKKSISETEKNNRGCNDQIMWETQKCIIRGITIKYSSKKKRIRNNEILKLTKQYRVIELKIAQLDRDSYKKTITSLQNTLAEIKDRLIKKNAEITKGAIIRSKQINYEEEDKCTKYFIGLEKSRGEKKCIKKLTTERGEINKMEEILEEEVDFYKNLYTTTRKIKGEQNDKIHEFLNKLEHKKISEESNHKLNLPITMAELEKALKETPDDKSPGYGGYTGEFYKFFWPEIKDYVYNALKYNINTKSLSTSQRQAMITLLPKEGKNLLELKNWRPISLLNTDYKLLARIVANRIKDTLPEIISEDQNGFVPNRYIGINIRKTLQVIEDIKTENKNGTIINIDFEKAFDCVEWDFIKASLELFNYPKGIVDMIETLYQDIQTCISNNGYISEFFNPSRGVRQGCPASPYIFVITAETLALHIKQRSEIMGVKIRNTEYLINQFADDTMLIVENNEDNINKCFLALDQFHKVSGLKVNKGKTEMLIINEPDRRQQKTDNNNWVVNYTKTLGIKISNNIKETIELNYNGTLENIRDKLLRWGRRKMSFIGKVMILKTMALSTIIYILTNLPTPSLLYIKELEDIIYKFFWSGKNERLARRTVIGHIDLGGIKMPKILTLNNALKIGWIIRLYKNKGSWTNSILEGLRLPETEEMRDYFLRSNLLPKHLKIYIKTNCSILWNQTLYLWYEYNFKDKELIVDTEEILNQHLFFNSCILINNKPLHNMKMFNVGIRKIKDIYDMKNNRFKNLGEIQKEYKTDIPVLTYLGIYTSIPKVWKNVLKDKDRVEIIKLCTSTR